MDFSTTILKKVRRTQNISGSSTSVTQTVQKRIGVLVTGVTEKLHARA
jgi:hypothetical protein